MPDRERHICPFCKEVIDERDWPPPLLDRQRLEKIACDHLETRHPIRWRFSPRFRRGVLFSRQLIEKEDD